MRPIVLVHGIARFDFLGELVRGWNIPWLHSFERFQYFKGIDDHLNAHGFNDILTPNLDWAAPSANRADTLKKAILPFLEQTGAEKVHLIAHSMGGLDSRRMVTDLEMAGKVASLTTIGTPHLGTILADDAIKEGGSILIDASEKFFHLDLRGNHDLTVKASETFNAERRNAEAKNGVYYQTYSAHEDKDKIFTPLVIPFKHILKREGENDGLVPVRSQKWTEQLTADDGTTKDVAQHEFPFDADHLNECGWWDWQERNGMFDLSNPLKQKREYEDKVKAIYLEIAQSVQNL